LSKNGFRAFSFATISLSHFYKLKWTANWSLDPQELKKQRKTGLLAATDGRYVRSCQIPVLGFSPIKNHPILLHDHNERIHESCLLEGREIYQKLIPKLASVE
jgi:acetylornithine deacetylase/succinyl-diaminopimelate desuccinylase-like protein